MDRRDYDKFRRNLRRVPARRVATVAVVVFILIALIGSALTMFYTVDAREVGVVLRFGKFTEIVEPGLHWKLPFGIDTVDIVPTQLVKKEEFGFRTLQAGKRTTYDQSSQGKKRYKKVSNMLTGDLKMADVQWVVQYKIRDAKEYLFSVREPDATLRDASEAAMRLVVGDYSMADVLTSKRAEIENAVRDKLQASLDAYKAGLSIDAVQLQDVNPPPKVKDAFNEVNMARQEKETTINKAQKEFFQAIPAARGEKQKAIAEAQGFKAKRVNEALGDVANFSALLSEYEKSRDITRTRLYLETLQDVLPSLQQIYIIDGSKGEPLQVLDLKDAAAAARSGRPASGRASASKRGSPSRRAGS